MVGYSRQKIETSDEQNIAIGLITSEEFAMRLVPVIQNKLDLIESVPLRTIIVWSMEYFDRYEKVPNDIIQDIFSSNKQALPPERADAIEATLLHLNERMKNTHTFNVEYYASKSRDYIETKYLEKITSAVQGALKQGKLDQARKLLTEVDKVEKQFGLGTDVFNDHDFVERMYASVQESVIRFPIKALTDLFSDLYYGDVVGIAGPSKAGKSFMLNQMALYSLYSGLNVAIFSWEMRDTLVGLRLFQNLMGESRKEMMEEEEIPYFDKDGNIAHNVVKKEGLKRMEVEQYRDKFRKFYAKSMGHLEVFDHHTCGRTVSDVCDALDRIEKYRGLKIDVVILDYDELMANEPSFRGQRWEGLNVLWRDIKNRVAQDRDSIVFAGSQLGKEAMYGEVDPRQTSGSSHKFDHMSLFIQLIFTEAERRLGVMRINAQGRHDKFLASNKIVLLQGLSLARPILDAKWESEIPNFKDILAATEKEIMENDIESAKKKKKKEENNKKKGFTF